MCNAPSEIHCTVTMNLRTLANQPVAHLPEVMSPCLLENSRIREGCFFQLGYGSATQIPPCGGGNGPEVRQVRHMWDFLGHHRSQTQDGTEVTNQPCGWYDYISSITVQMHSHVRSHSEVPLVWGNSVLQTLEVDLGPVKGTQGQITEDAARGAIDAMEKDASSASFHRY